MRPSPFSNKLKKIGKKPNLPPKKQEQPDQQLAQEKQPQKKFKNPRDIYDALNTNEEQEKKLSPKQEQQTSTKKSVNFKPKFKFANKKNIELPTTQEPQQKNETQEPEIKDKPMFLKPTLPRRKIQRKSREKVLIEEDEPKQQEQSYDGSISQNPSFAPHFKIGRSRVEENKFQPITSQNENEGNYQQKHQIGVNVARQVNFEAPIMKVSSVKVEKQRARTEQLRGLLNLQQDLYEQTFSISCVTPYEIYINKIKNGSLKNSCDQAFDQKTVAECQTLTMEYDDFMNQCPQDYHMDVNNIVQTDTDELFSLFVQKVSPVLQELIRPSSEVVMPPIFLLALRPTFKKFVKCPFPVFVYYSDSMKLGILVIGEKLYVSESEITSVISIGNNLIGGGVNGTLMIWSGKNNRGSRLYKKIYDTIESTNFQLPQYETNELDKFSVYRSDVPITSLLQESENSFWSLDENGKMVRWQIQDIGGKKNQLKPCQSVEFQTLLRKPSLIAHSLMKRAENYYVNTSMGILVWNNEYILQKLDLEGEQVIDFALPHRSNLIYVLSKEGLKIFDQHYSNNLLSINIGRKEKLTNIIIPQIEYENRKVSMTNNFFVAGQGIIYSFNLLKNKIQGRVISSKEDDHDDRNIIFRGANALTEGIEQVTLWKDLKCTSEIKKMNINLDSSQSNVKSIMEENRKLYHLLQAEPGLAQ